MLENNAYYMWEQFQLSIAHHCESPDSNLFLPSIHAHAEMARTKQRLYLDFIDFHIIFGHRALCGMLHSIVGALLNFIDNLHEHEEEYRALGKESHHWRAEFRRLAHPFQLVSVQSVQWSLCLSESVIRWRWPKCQPRCVWLSQTGQMMVPHVLSLDRLQIRQLSPIAQCN